MALGYLYLVEQYQLAALPLQTVAQVDPMIKGRQTRSIGNQDIQVFEPKYQPEAGLVRHLQFALRYEGINLEVLYLLFRQTGRDELNAWLIERPTSSYARRTGFLYEWLSGDKLNVNVPAKERYVALVDNTLQFGLTRGEKDTRFRVNNNLPGNKNFCPLVRRTKFLNEMIANDLREKPVKRCRVMIWIFCGVRPDIST